MDAGGDFPGLFGVGPDNIGGTADDVDYDFGEDDVLPGRGLHRHRGHAEHHGLGPDQGQGEMTR